MRFKKSSESGWQISPQANTARGRDDGPRPLNSGLPRISVVKVLAAVVALVLAFELPASAADVAILGLSRATTDEEKQALEGFQAYIKTLSQMQEVDSASIRKFLIRKELKNISQGKKAIRDAESFYRNGRQLYDEGNFPASLAKFRQALDKFDAGWVYLQDFRSMLMSQLFLGMAHLRLNQKKQAKTAITKMVHLDFHRARRRLSPNRYPESVLSMYDGAKAKITKRGVASIFLKSPETETKVYFDGQEIGVAPTIVKNVAMGEHKVVFFKRGYKRLVQTVNVKNRSELTVEASLSREHSFGFVEKAKLAGLRSDLKEIGDAIGASLLLLATTKTRGSKVEISGQIVDVDDEISSRVVTESTTRPSLVKQKAFKAARRLFENVNAKGDLSSKLAPPVMVDAGRSNDQNLISSKQRKRSLRMQKDRSSSIFTKWWFWTGVGVLAAGGAGAYFLLDSSGSDSPVFVIPNPVP